MKADKTERIEVRLRSSVASEAELIAELEKLDGTYGGMNELMRKCLVRGFLLLEKRLQSVSGTSSELEALDALAQAFDSDDCDHRLIKTFLDARSAAREPRANSESTAPMSVQPPVLPEARPASETLAVSAPLQAALVDDGEPNSLALGLLQLSENSEATKGVMSEPEPEPETVVQAPPKKHDWTALRNVAGAAASGGPSKSGGSSGGEDE